MNDLTTPQGVLAYLSNTCFAATNVQRIVGGFSSFTYRVTLSLPLEDGSTTLVLKHYEGYVAASPGFKLDSARSEFEYNALVALWDSGLVDGDSVVQVPRPIHYDRETHSIFLADLGSDIVNLNVMFDDRLQGAYSDPDLAEIQNVASTIGSALGDFLGRVHGWSSFSEHRAPFLHPHRQEDLFKIFRDLAARSATKFGIKEEWLTNMLAEELRKSSTDDQVLVMGDFSL
ncbi:putative APH domain protein, partial [Rhizoctonia solani 123E]